MTMIELFEHDEAVIHEEKDSSRTALGSYKICSSVPDENEEVKSFSFVSISRRSITEVEKCSFCNRRQLKTLVVFFFIFGYVSNIFIIVYIDCHVLRRSVNNILGAFTVLRNTIDLYSRQLDLTYQMAALYL